MTDWRKDQSSSSSTENKAGITTTLWSEGIMHHTSDILKQASFTRYHASGTALHWGLSKYMTAQDTQCNPTPSKHKWTMYPKDWNISELVTTKYSVIPFLRPNAIREVIQVERKKVPVWILSKWRWPPPLVFLDAFKENYFNPILDGLKFLKMFVFCLSSILCLGKCLNPSRKKYLNFLGLCSPPPPC